MRDRKSDLIVQKILHHEEGGGRRIFDPEDKIILPGHVIFRVYLIKHEQEQYYEIDCDIGLIKSHRQCHQKCTEYKTRDGLFFIEQICAVYSGKRAEIIERRREHVSEDVGDRRETHHHSGNCDGKKTIIDAKPLKDQMTDKSKCYDRDDPVKKRQAVIPAQKNIFGDLSGQSQKPASEPVCLADAVKPRNIVVI